MTVIKIQKDSLRVAAEKAYKKSTEYKEKVIRAELSFTEMGEVLLGSGYDELLTQVSKKIDAQKKLVVECEILSEKIHHYNNTMTDSESSVSFPS